MITGVDFVIYSTTSVFQIVDDFYKCLKTRWEHFIVEKLDFRDNECLELFFAKNEEMNFHHEENGFSLDDNSEGCFMLFGKKMDVTNLDIIVKEQTHYRSTMITDAYDSKIIAKDIWMFTLVLPDTIEDNKFCNFIMDSLLNLLMNSFR